MNLYHLTLCTGNEPGQIFPRVPKNHLTEENDTVPRICVAPTLDDCLTGIGVSNIVTEKLLSILRSGERDVGVTRGLLLPFIVRTYSVDCNDYTLRMSKDIVDDVPDAVLSNECWLTEYRKPVRIKKKWLVDADIETHLFMHDDMIFDYSVIKNSVWSKAETPVVPKFRDHAFSITRRWLTQNNK